MKKSGGLFDFNHDGEVSFGEHALGMTAILGMLSELENEKLSVEFSVEEDDFDEMDREELETRLEELRDKRDELDDEEPDDIDSEAYDEWEERCDELDAKIEEIEELLEE